MKLAAVSRFISLCLVLLLLSSVPLIAQEDNLLTNPGFEDGFTSVSGEQPRSVANGWTPWHAPRTDGMRSFENAQPRYIASSAAESDGVFPRVRSGADSQIYYSFFETHDGGLYQQVSGITPGTEIRFSVYAHIWSSTFEDFNISEDPGDVSFRVGIDPTGGTDALSSSVQYSEVAFFYDTFRQYAIIATAESETVTVFLRSTVGEPVFNSYMYVDDAVLAVTVDSTTPVETDEPAPTDVPAVTDEPTATDEPPTATDEPPTATDEPPTATDEPPTATDEPPTATDEPAVTDEPTATDEPVVTDEPTVDNATGQDDPTPTREGGDPDPTGTPIPVVTETPTASPTATDKPAPTDTPDSGLVPTATPVGGEGTGTDDDPPATDVPAVGGNEGETTGPISEDFPGTVIHTVRPGDTVGRLAVLYGSTTEVIIEANGLNDNALIRVGQGLVVPVRLANPATETPSPTPLVVVVTATTGTGDVTGGTGGSTGGITGTSTYTVQRGDTLSAIANRFNTTIAALSQLNGIANPNRIFSGQVLTIPGTGGSDGAAPSTDSIVNDDNADVAATEESSSDEGDMVDLVTPEAPASPQTYVVQPGDNLYRIALQLDVSLIALAEANGITNFNRIFSGQVLTVP